MKRIFLIISTVCMALLSLTACGSKSESSGPSIHQKEDDDDPTSGNIPSEDNEITPWTKGVLDIHFINTSMGECTFIIMPDGTQLLVDAAGSLTPTGPVSSSVSNVEMRKRWDPTTDASFDCGTFIEDYIRKCMTWTGNNTIDYVLLSHFHNDHYGAHLGCKVSSNSSTYKRQSLVAILEDMPVGKLYDRGWPDYDYPFDMMKYYKATSESSVYNYITAVKWLSANKGLKVEKFVAGSSTQLKPLYDESYSCRVQNLSVNGDVWTGVGTGYTATFPAKQDIVCEAPPSVENTDKCPEENHVSCTFRLSYGTFDYFAGADMQYDGLSSFAWKDIETPVTKACGAVDVMKADHHGTNNTNGTGYKDKAWAMKYTYPQCWIVNSWTDAHPRQTTYESVTAYCPDMDVFITNSNDTQRSTYKDYSKRVKGADGHIVVRVMNGGTKFYVCTLTDSDGKMTVKKVSGPYTSR